MIDQSTLKLYKNLWVRKDRHDDRNMIRECLDVYQYFDFRPDDVVLDLGVNVGGFAAMALSRKIKKYVGVEADPENVEIAEMNIKRNNPHLAEIELLSGAASTSTEKELTFYQTESGNAKCSGTIVITSHNRAMRKVHYVVKNYNLRALLETVRPTIVKMDIEGAEHAWLEQNGGAFPSYVREIAFDLHHRKDIEKFETHYLPRIKEDFELVHASANTAFEQKKELVYDFPGLNLRGTGVVYCVDAFFRRK